MGVGWIGKPIGAYVGRGYKNKRRYDKIVELQKCQIKGEYMGKDNKVSRSGLHFKIYFY